MTFILDASFAHAHITPAAVKKTGAKGVILYAGCADTAKNATRAEVQALLKAGIWVGFVIENNATDALGGRAVGIAHGNAIVAAVKKLGYDWQNCMLSGGYDANATTDAQRAKLLAYAQGFASVVPVPCQYFDSDTIDYVHAKLPDCLFWQDNSTSFSPKNPTPNASLWQQFNDPRGGALRSMVDVNNQLAPTYLMGEPVQLTPQQKTQSEAIADARIARALGANGAISVSNRSMILRAFQAYHRGQGSGVFTAAAHPLLFGKGIAAAVQGRLSAVEKSVSNLSKKG